MVENNTLLIIIHLYITFIIVKHKWLSFFVVFFYKKESKSFKINDSPNGAPHNLLISSPSIHMMPSSLIQLCFLSKNSLF